MITLLLSLPRWLRWVILGGRHAAAIQALRRDIDRIDMRHSRMINAQKESPPEVTQPSPFDIGAYPYLQTHPWNAEKEKVEADGPK